MAVTSAAIARSGVWLEVALNGGRGRAWQPTMPISPQDIIHEALACVDRGAAIVHYHAYDAETGLQMERDLDAHRRIMEGIRSRCDAIVYPTTAMRVLGRPQLAAADRFSVEAALLEEGLLEAFVLDPGSMNMSHAAARAASYVYVNEVQEVERGLVFAARHRMVPMLAIYEMGFARLASALARAACSGCDPCVYRIMFSDGFSYGLPPSAAAIRVIDEAVRLLGPSRWMLAGLDFDQEPWTELALTLGADLRVGLEDAPRASRALNAELVTTAVQHIHRAGRSLSSPADIRAELAAGWSLTAEGSSAT